MNIKKHINEHDIDLSNNGWQNIGIMTIWSMNNISDDKYRWTFIKLVIHSFGFKQKKTLHKTVNNWSKEFDISTSTFERHIKWLMEKKFVKANTSKGYVVGGGSRPNSYSPCFPKGYAKILLSDEKQTNKEIVDSKNEDINNML